MLRGPSEVPNTPRKQLKPTWDATYQTPFGWSVDGWTAATAAGLSAADRQPAAGGQLFGAEAKLLLW